jgi:O-antigen ligase
MLTAGMGVWAAYDRAGDLVIFSKPTPAGWPVLWGLALALLLYYALATLETETQRRWALALLAGFGAGIAVWFTVTNDWIAHPAELAMITHLGRAIQAWLPVLTGHRLNANIAGGIVATLLPTSLGLMIEAIGRDRRRRWPWAIWGLATGASMAFGLLLTTSLGAWLAVGGGLALGVVWWSAGRLSRGRRRLGLFVGLVGLGAVVGAVCVALSPLLRSVLQQRLGLANRPGLFYETALLLRDYPFTGAGMGEFALVHSTYALMIHVPVLPHAHSLYLDVALGQGIIGALAMVGVLGGAAVLGLRALDGPQEPRPALIAGLLSLAVMAIHGLVDDPLYGSRGMTLLWVPAGLVVAGAQRIPAGRRVARSQKAWRWWAVAIAAVVGLALLSLFWPSARAAWYANLGAVRQTRVELGAYDPNHFDNLTLDQIREGADLAIAEHCFARALTLRPGQVTARTRLAQIALGRGQYDGALNHAQAAWDAGHRDRVTRLLLGDALVAVGEVEAGVEIVRGLKWAEDRLEGQAWSRYWVNGDYRRAADAWRAVVKLNPENERAVGAIAAAEAREKSQ